MTSTVNTLVGCWRQHHLLACLGSGFCLLGSVFWVLSSGFCLLGPGYLAIWLSGLAIWLSGLDIWLSGVWSSLHRVWVRGSGGLGASGESRIPTGCTTNLGSGGFTRVGQLVRPLWTSTDPWEGHCVPTLDIDPSLGSGGFDSWVLGDLQGLVT